MTNSRSEGYRLRAEELRVVASEAMRTEYRQFLLLIAQDYDRMACSAELISDSCQRLAEVTEKLDQSAEKSARKANGNGNGNGDSVQACRTMAEDASRLGADAEGTTRDAWLQLSERWSTLANNLERAEERDGRTARD